MRTLKFIASLAVASMALSVSSCTKDTDTDSNFTVVYPTDDSDYEYLADYDVIKSYTTANVGASVDAAIYNQGGAMAVLINSNFDEVVASYHMKYGSVVKDDGSMDFSVVDKFVENATEAGVNVYGHALCWHSGQNTTYLNSLVADKWIADESQINSISSRPSPTRAIKVTNAMFTAQKVAASSSATVITNGDFESDDTSSFFVSDNNGAGVTGVISDAGAGADGVGHSFILTNPVAGDNWHAQLGVQFPDTPFAEGEEWTLSFDVKSENGSAFSGTHIQGSESYDALAGKYYGDIATTTEWSHVELPISVDTDGVVGGIKIVLGFGHVVDVFYVDNIVVAQQEDTSSDSDDTATGDWTQIMFEGDFSDSNKGVTYDIYNTSDDDTYSVITDGDNSLLQIVNTTAGNNWEPQLTALLPAGVSFGAGEVWQFKCKVKSLNGSIIDGVSFQVAEGGDALSGKYYSMTTSTEWQELTLDIDVDGEGLATAGKIVMGLGTDVDTFTFDDIQFLKSTSTTEGGDTEDDDDTSTEYEWGDELIANGDFEEEVDFFETTNWLAQVNTQSSGSDFAFVDGVDGGKALMMNNSTICTNKWDTQFIIMPLLGDFAASDILKVEFDIKSDNGSTITGAHSQTTAYAAAFSSGDITTSSEWTRYTFIFTNAAGGTNFAMQFGDVVDTFYLDNVSFQKAYIPVTGGYYEPLTDQEKKENVTAAMQEWVTEMISHTKGSVKVWDVVNESIDDSTPTSLRTNGGVTETDNFYWQDYMGQDYVRDIVRMAREAAGDEELLLFINDYGLEFAHDSNAKCDALIDWIEYWESDSETVIDGIGTQMHVSLSLTDAYQKQQEEAVEAMFTKLAATGKLIKVSELDMRIVLSDGTYQMTADTSDEEHKLMSDYYDFIVSKYFEIIPEAQQYGITHWSPTDATDDESAWCAGEPIGLWTTSYARKHAYAGFVEGLILD